MSDAHPRDDCYFCDEKDILEQHHIVPRRFEGEDHDNNLVTVCPTCHEKLESLYDKRFYRALGVGSTDAIVQYAAHDVSERLEEAARDLSDELRDVADEIEDDYGKGTDVEEILANIGDRYFDEGRADEAAQTEDLVLEVADALDNGGEEEGAPRQKLIDLASRRLGANPAEIRDAIEQLHLDGRLYESPADYLHTI